MEEQRWRTVVENPLSANLMTMTQFIQQCSNTPHTVNDVVFVGTFAVFQDYEVCTKTLSSLPNLRRLGFVNAHMQMFQLKVPTLLRNVTDISFRSCRLSQFPVNILILLGMQLRSIDLANNFLTSLSVLGPHLKMCYNLSSINLSKNQFSELPEDVSLVGSLAKLNISNNRVTDITADHFSKLKRLQHLDLSYNGSITELPRELFELPDLRRLDLTGLTNLVSPPYELAKDGIDVVKKYFANKAKNRWLEGKKDTA